MSFSYRSVQPVVERFEGNASIAEAGGEVMAKHSNEIARCVAAQTHIKHVNKSSNVLSISRDDQVVQVPKEGATSFSLFDTKGIKSFQNQKWNGSTFNYTYDLTSAQPVKISETYSYAFASRDKIQRGDGTVNPLVPTKQLGRETTLEFLSKKLEHAISDLTICSENSSEQDL